jgi:hypothetical protein
MPRKDHARPDVLNQPLHQGFVRLPEHQVANNPPNRPKSVAVRRGKLGLPEGIKTRERPNFGFGKNKTDY